MPNYSGNIPGVTPQARAPGIQQWLSSPQQAQYAFGPAQGLQQAPGPGGNNALSNAYTQTMPYWQPANGQSNGSTFTNPANSLPGAGREWDHLMTSLYGSGNGPPPSASGNSGNGSGNGGNGGNGSSSGSDAVTSSITPRNVFSDSQTQQGINSASAQAFMQGDPRLLQQKFGGRGRSLDAGTLSAVMPQVAAAENASATAEQAIPIRDFYENQQSQLQGQSGRAGESLALANILSQLQGARQQNSLQQQSMLWPLFSAMGGI